MTATKDLTHEVRKVARVSVLSKLNRIILGKKTRVRTSGQGPYGAPAWTDGKDVFLANKSLSAPWSDLLGANYHELAHILYTPSRNTEVAKGMRHNHLQRTFNLLEDMRIEALMIDRWSPLVPYFKLMFSRWVVNGDSALDSAYFWAVGRRYLPVELRAKLRNAFARQDILPSVERVVAEYMAIDPRNSPQEAIDLAAEYQRLMADASQNISEHMDDIATSGTASAGEVKEQIERILEELGHDQEALEELAEELAEGEGIPVPVPADGAPEEGDDDEAGEGPSNEDGDEAEQPESGDGAGGPKTDPMEDILQDISDLKAEAEDEVNETASDYEAAEQEEAQRLLEDYEVGLGANKDGNFRRDAQRVDREQTRAARKMATKFDRLLDELAPTWDRHQKSGRLDVRAVMDSDRRGGIDTDVFRRWQEGSEDLASLDVGIAVDMSGSMGGRIASAARTLWTIRRTFDLYEGESAVSVVGFHNSVVPLYGHKERPERGSYKVPITTGSTQPEFALAELGKRWQASKMEHKFLFLLTDGSFNSDHPVYQQLNVLRQMGVKIVIVGIKISVDRHKEQADVTATINKMDDLLPMVNQLVTEALTNTGRPVPV